MLELLPDSPEPGRLRQAAVVVAGAGNIGSHLAPLLARAGVGLVRVVDRDRVEEKNLAGQDFRPGDVQFLNNGRILHAREAYEDDDDPARRRHLLRLWLAAHRFASVEPGLRVGIGGRP